MFSDSVTYPTDMTQLRVCVTNEVWTLMRADNVWKKSNNRPTANYMAYDFHADKFVGDVQFVKNKRSYNKNNNFISRG